MIDRRMQELTSIMNLSDDEPLPSDKLVTAIMELEDLRSELEFLRDDSPDSDEPDAFVGAPLNPPPHLNSGAIELPEPDESSN